MGSREHPTPWHRYSDTVGGGVAGDLGTYRARDGSPGARVSIDLDGPHAALVVGKRGYGKSYTLGVLVEELTAADGVTPVVADPMGAFTTFAAVSDFEVDADPRVSASALTSRAGCDIIRSRPRESDGVARLAGRARLRDARRDGSVRLEREHDAGRSAGGAKSPRARRLVGRVLTRWTHGGRLREVRVRYRARLLWIQGQRR